VPEQTRYEKLVADAKRNVTEISPNDAVEKMKTGEATIIDVRERDEWDEEHILGASHLSRARLN
jgi:rhodanese-related sulfurtransferase